MTEEIQLPVLYHTEIPQEARDSFVEIGGRKLSIIGFGIKRASQFKVNENNFRQHPKTQQRAVEGSLSSLGWVDVCLENIVTGNLVDGHERVWNALQNGDGYVPFIQVELTEEEENLALISLDPIAAMARTDEDKLKSLMVQIKEAQDEKPLNENTVEFLSDLAEREKIENPFEEEKIQDVEPEVDRAEELQKKWGVKTGDLFALGNHRLLCGDCTDEAVVELVMMGGEKAVLLHADPPYGMGKEKEGVANDNLYKDKLDAFQMFWWDACRGSLEDNASAYIWGNAEDLWRLWYLGGLKDSERLTFRDQIIWARGGFGAAGSGTGVGSEIQRSYFPETESSFFFMLGEQGFSTNADNYWDGWEPIRKYLKEQRDLMGWGIADCKIIAGHSQKSGCHWFDRSQWTMPTEEVYNSWKQEAKRKAFKREYDSLKREYDSLKREYYETRAYFDNTHDLMTDVWQFNRVKGDDRWFHPTPKPVEMMERILKSSSPEGSVVLVPFGGSCPEIIAAERNNRKLRIIELSEKWCSVILERYFLATGITPELIEQNP